MMNTRWIKTVAISFLFLTTHALAEPTLPCTFENSGVNLRSFKTSKYVSGFTEIKRKKDYSGSLNKIGGFYLELFSCVHHGAKITVLLGPEINPSHLKKVLSVLPNLLFPEAHSMQVQNALLAIPQDTLFERTHLNQLALSLGLSDASIQLLNAEGMHVLVFEFYGG